LEVIKKVYIFALLKTKKRMKTFIYWNVHAKKSADYIKNLMDKEANGEPYRYAIVN